MNKRPKSSAVPLTAIGGVVLAGGLARRMGGGDKALVPVAGRPMLGHVVDRLRPQVAACVINANGDPSRFDNFDAPVVADPVAGFAGPLAGILAGLMWAEHSRPDLTHMVSVAGDTPFFPADLVTRLSDGIARQKDDIALAVSDDRVHPVFGLWPVELAGDLRRFLSDGNDRKILSFVARHRACRIGFPSIRARRDVIDPFFNVNRPDDVEKAERLASLLSATETA